MATEFKLPELAEGIKAAQVISVLVAEGDTVSEGQPVIEVETDKAAAEIPSPVAGVIKKLNVKEGDNAPVGSVIAVIEETGGGAPAKQEEEKAPEAAQQEESAPEDAPAKAEGEAEEPPAPPAATPAATMPGIPARPEGKLAPASPSVRRFAREIGIDVNIVPGSGPGGRVSIEDVKQYAKQRNTGMVAAGGGIAAPPLPDFSRFGTVRREAMSKIRKRTAQNTAVSWATVPHVTQFDVADISRLNQLRKKFAPRAEKAGGNLTITAMLLKVVASALKVFPKFNASVDMAGGEIIFKEFCNIGIAIDTPKGLLVPVLKDVTSKNMLEIATALTQMGERARAGKSRLDELEGGTFTVSNVGSLGGTYFTPIVNYPEVAILGMGRAREEAVFVDGVPQPRLMMPLSLSYDHRLIDGAEGIRFLRWVIEALEEPLLLSLEG